ncbi:MAG TPA: polyprenyl synthetase family protein [Anaerolineales bacterium]|nr:polyprenyl synthetase family protein [Anaerolineales bacterium]
MSLETLTQTYRPALEETLRNAVQRAAGADFPELQAMMAYHLGWEGEGAGPEATGKRIRPILTLLTTQAAGKKWEHALPAAAAIELIHNFSLIHDDIEDNSALRRGRPALWKKWGIPQAINTGDAMFSLAHLTILSLAESNSMEVTLQAAAALQRSCLNLTQGQHLDIAYETERSLPIEAYWPMVGGKTASLIQACTEIGALVAQADAPIRNAYLRFGRNLGLAFQVLDDILGIWGDSEKLGKSSVSDLVDGKKSLPVLYGLSQKGEFAARWVRGPIRPEEVPALAVQLENEGGRDFAQSEAARLTDSALAALDEAQPQGEAGKALRELAGKLLQREV